MEGQNDIGTLALTTSGVSLTSVIRTPLSEEHPEFSPDGRWLACQSNETGRMEVYLQRSGGPRQRVQMSRTGGTDPAWNPKGRELFYLSPDEAGTS
jgi:serine/threonine-protein kinase